MLPEPKLPNPVEGVEELKPVEAPNVEAGAVLPKPVEVEGAVVVPKPEVFEPKVPPVLPKPVVEAGRPNALVEVPNALPVEAGAAVEPKPLPLPKPPALKPLKPEEGAPGAGVPNGDCCCCCG